MKMNQEQRLEDIFKENNNKGIAIAITGQWGVGKTYFWKSFIDKKAKVREEQERKYLPASSRTNQKNLFNKKYAYVSLFGIESLADLKTAICTNLSSNHFSEAVNPNLEVPILAKRLITSLKDVKLSKSGISSSARILESLLFLQVRDAIICFDDFERLSKKLDIKDIMGLANYLKLEKNCQVILLLDESKTKDQNDYAIYKEKLVDEEIKITSIKPLIEAYATNLELDLRNLLIEFSEKLGIHNFRFTQKVLRLYQLFIKELQHPIAESTKEIILLRILQGYLITDFPLLEYDWKHSSYFTESKRKNWSANKQSTYQILESISYVFVTSDEWLYEFKKWFDQEEMDFTKIRALANSHLIDEKNNNTRKKITILMEQWRNLEVDDQFCQELFGSAQERIGFESLENLEFYCQLLKRFGESDLSQKLKRAIKIWIDQSMQERGENFSSTVFHFGFNKDNLFHRYIKYVKQKNPVLGLPSLFDVMTRYILNSGWNDSNKTVLAQATKQDWEDLIWKKIPEDERFDDMQKMQIIRKILEQSIDPNLHPKIQTIIFEILEDKAQLADISQRKNIEYVISRLKE